MRFGCWVIGDFVTIGMAHDAWWRRRLVAKCKGDC
jgi:hypothetical protein